MYYRVRIVLSDLCFHAGICRDRREHTADIRVLLCDEVDRYPVSAGTEGYPVIASHEEKKSGCFQVNAFASAFENTSGNT